MFMDEFDGNPAGKRAYFKKEIENARKKELKTPSNEGPKQENNWTATQNPEALEVMYIIYVIKQIF